MNTNLLFATVCMLVTGGALMIASGWKKREVVPAKEKKSVGISDALKLRFYRAAGAFVVVLVITSWPVMAVGAALVGFYSSEMFGGKAERKKNVDRVEAIASWTEMLRDTLTASHGLEAAIMATAAIAPFAIQTEVREFAIRVQQSSLEDALVILGQDLAHPVGDLVVVSLTLAAGGSSRELGELLTTLADTAREETTMRLKIDAQRSKSRSSVNIITGFTLAVALGMPIVSADYLKPYNTFEGQIVLLVIVGMWSFSLSSFRALSRFKQPERFFVEIDEPELEVSPL